MDVSSFVFSSPVEHVGCSQAQAKQPFAPVHVYKELIMYISQGSPENRTNGCVYVYMYIYVCVYVYTHSMCVYTYSVCVYTYVYMNMYTHIV